MIGNERVFPQVFVFERTDPPEEYRLHVSLGPAFVYTDEFPDRADRARNILHHSCCEVIQRTLRPDAEPLRVARIVCADLGHLRAWLERFRGRLDTWYQDCPLCRPGDPAHAQEPARMFSLERLSPHGTPLEG
jgi:hypothetical protein